MYICKNNNYLELFPAFRCNLFFRASKKGFPLHSGLKNKYYEKIVVAIFVVGGFIFV